MTNSQYYLVVQQLEQQADERDQQRLSSAVDDAVDDYMTVGVGRTIFEVTWVLQRYFPFRLIRRVAE